MTKVREVISRIRNAVKGTKEDAFLTDRQIFSIVNKYAKMLIRRQDNEAKLMRMFTLFKTIPCLELEEVSLVEACCANIKTACTIKRTKEKLNNILEGAYGPVIRAVASLDRSQEATMVHPSTYTNMANSTNFKYNKTIYYWYLDGYIYLPNVEWDAILLEAIFSDSIESFLCDSDQESECVSAQEENISLPDYMLAEAEQLTIQELLIAVKLPSNTDDDAQNILR
jgi:hypothetical protein